MPKGPAVAPPPDGSWDNVIGLVACAAVAAFPFLPDEKLNRLKLVALQLGILSLLAAVGARAIGSARIPFSWRGDAARPQGDVATPVLAVAAWLVVNFVLSLAAVDSALARAELGRVALAGAAFFAFFSAGLTDRWQSRVLFSWTTAALVMAFYASLQRRGGLGPIIVPQMDRAIGTFGNPIFLAAYLVLSAFVAAAAMREAQTEAARYFGVSAVVVIVAAIAATGTRSAYVGLAAAAMVSVFIVGSHERARIAVSAVIAVVLAAIISHPLWSRDQAHLLIWRDTLRLIAAHPLAGVGLGAFHVYFPSVAQPDLIAKWPKGSFVVNYAHNEYLQALAEGGPALLASFLTIFLTFLLVVRVRARVTDCPRSVVPLTLGVVAVAVQNLFSVDMRFSVSLASTFAVMGLALADSDRRARWLPAEVVASSIGTRTLLAVMWTGVVAFSGYALVLRPHWNQREVAQAPDFFDQRLLEPAKTIGDLEALSVRYPSEAAVQEKLGYACAKEMKSADGRLNPDMTARAVAAYQKVIAIDGKRVSAHNNLGNIFYTAGRSDDAIVEWQRAAELDPAFIDPRLNLGKVLYVRGDLKEASSWFQAVLKIQPGEAEAELYLRRMVE